MTATITVDSLKTEALAGLKDPERLLAAFNTLQQQVGGALNGSSANGLTAANARRLVLADKEVITPDDWVRLELQNDFLDDGGPGAEVAVRKTADGTVRLREVIKRPTDGFPDDGTVIAELPPGYAPAGTAFINVGASEGVGVIKVIPAGSGASQLVYRSGDASSYMTISGQWTAQDRSLPAWSTPLKLALPVDTAVSIRAVWVVARSSVGEAGLIVPAVCYAPSVERTSAGGRVLVLPRIDGLQPLTRYRLTFWVFLE